MVLILLSFVDISGFLNKIQRFGNDANSSISVITDDFVVDSADIEEENLLVNLDKICECEKTFKNPYPIEWSGQVIARFLSGADLGIKRFNQSGKYKQFYVSAEGLFDGENGDSIKVKGKMVGITCAYYNTVFGECVPDVVANSVEIIK